MTPPFDPQAFAEEVLRPSPAAGTPAVRPSAQGKPTPKGTPRAPMPTLSDPGETETARVRSMRRDSQPGPEPRRATPTGTLSLANARVPSNLPPPPTSRARRDTKRRSSRSQEDAATSPPPPMARELLESAFADEPPATKQVPAVPEAGAARNEPTEHEMNERVALGDYTGALDVAERLLEREPAHPSALACAEACRGVLRKMYTARIGPLDRVPQVMVPRDQLRWLTIDHRAGFVLSLIDGVSSLEMILDVSGMPELDALRILADLAQQRIISFRA